MGTFVRCAAQRRGHTPAVAVLCLLASVAALPLTAQTPSGGEQRSRDHSAAQDATPVALDERLAAEAAARAATDTARARLEPLRGSDVRGTVDLFHTPGVLVLHVELRGLSPGLHGFRIHARRDCELGARAVPQERFGPDDGAGEAPGAEDGADELGNLRAGEDGVVRQWLRVDGLELRGPRGAAGRAIVVHASPDELESEPAAEGDAGRAEACGVIVAG